MSTSEKYLTVQELCKALGYCRDTTRKYIREGVFPNAYRHGNSYRIPESDLIAFRERHRVVPEKRQSGGAK